MSTSTLAFGTASVIARARRIVRVMWPSPKVSWEYIATRGEEACPAMALLVKFAMLWFTAVRQRQKIQHLAWDVPRAEDNRIVRGIC